MLYEICLKAMSNKTRVGILKDQHWPENILQKKVKLKLFPSNFVQSSNPGYKIGEENNKLGCLGIISQKLEEIW